MCYRSTLLFAAPRKKSQAGTQKRPGSMWQVGSFRMDLYPYGCLDAAGFGVLAAPELCAPAPGNFFGSTSGPSLPGWLQPATEPIPRHIGPTSKRIRNALRTLLACDLDIISSSYRFMGPCERGTGEEPCAPVSLCGKASTLATNPPGSDCCRPDSRTRPWLRSIDRRIHWQWRRISM